MERGQQQQLPDIDLERYPGSTALPVNPADYSEQQPWAYQYPPPPPAPTDYSRTAPQQQQQQQQSGTSFGGSGRKASAPQRSQAVLVNKPSHQPQNRPRENLFQGSIIDNEKLKRMDDIDCSTDDDWARKDESFDYNKKIDRYYFFYFLTLFKILF